MLFDPEHSVAYGEFRDHPHGWIQNLLMISQKASLLHKAIAPGRFVTLVHPWLARIRTPASIQATAIRCRTFRCTTFRYRISIPRQLVTETFRRRDKWSRRANAGDASRRREFNLPAAIHTSLK